jgi:hypothetical protein
MKVLASPARRQPLAAEKKDRRPRPRTVKPITFGSIARAHGYRDVVRSGILEETGLDKIGISNAIVVEQQTDRCQVRTMDFGYASVAG